MRKTSDSFNLFSCADLDRDKIQQLAFETGFCKRSSGKVCAPNFLIQLCLQSVEGIVSYNDMAARMEIHTGVSVSRQAFWQRTNEACLRFFQRILEHIMLSKCSPKHIESIKKQGRFKRILLQDSTTIKLPLRLFKIFSGVNNGNTAVCNARIQGIYDLLSGNFIQFSIDPYSKNDQAATWEIPVQEGDLVLRDRGYFRIQVIEKHLEIGADTITRYKHHNTLYDFATGQKINLLNLLTCNNKVDLLVCSDPEAKIPLRLIAFPVSEETANLRRMKAKKEMHHNPSSELLKLMSWTIFLTTVRDPSLSFQEIYALYSLRWRIENIFKTWKSYFNFHKIHNVPEIQLRVLLTARFILITLTFERIFLPLSHQIYRQTNKFLSLIKVMRYITRNLSILPKILLTSNISPQFSRAFERYCTYEKRNRCNFMIDIESILFITGYSWS